MKDNKSHTFIIGVAIGTSIAVLVLVAFLCGVWVGRSNNPFLPMMGRFEGRDVFSRNIENHGVLGTIQTLGKNTLVVKDRRGILKTISVDDQTIVKRDNVLIQFSDLTQDDFVIVLGDPEKKEEIIKAKIIRVMEKLQTEGTRSGMMRGFRGSVSGL